MSFDVLLRRSVALVAAVGLAVGVPVYAQIAAATVPAYDAVSIKPNKPDGSGMIRMMINQGQDRYAGSNVTLKLMLRYAYNLTTDEQIVGLSGAVDSAHFDIEAKMDADTVEALKKMSKEDSAELRRKMMQAMLADRYKLTLHHETRELSLYDLVIAKGGFKLKESDPTATSASAIKGIDGAARPGMMRMGMGELTAQGVAISGLTGFLAQQLHKQVVDKTGLTGKYDINLKWQPDDMPAEHEASGGDPRPSIFTALQEEMGLKLESVKGPVDTIVVDHVEMPTEN